MASNPGIKQEPTDQAQPKAVSLPPPLAIAPAPTPASAPPPQSTPAPIAAAPSTTTATSFLPSNGTTSLHNSSTQAAGPPPSGMIQPQVTTDTLDMSALKDSMDAAVQSILADDQKDGKSNGNADTAKHDQLRAMYLAGFRAAGTL